MPKDDTIRLGRFPTVIADFGVAVVVNADPSGDSSSTQRRRKHRCIDNMMFGVDLQKAQEGKQLMYYCMARRQPKLLVGGIKVRL
jgi:phage FluMu gp28-like protein